MPYWLPLAIDGQTIDLSHLEPFEFELIPKGSDKAAVVSVRFSDHCFTEKYDPNRHKLFVTHSQSSNYEKRSFNQQRYYLSLQLPTLIRSLNEKRVSQTRNENLVRVELANGGEYGVFFTLRKESNNRCIMFVVSAYPLDRPRNTIIVTGEMKFNVALT